MYFDYFGLSHPPFKITPDTRLFFPGGNRGAVLQALIYAIANGEGIIKVVGEVGSGKTMLCRMLEDGLPERVDVVYLANPSLSPENLLHAIAFELRLDVEPDDSQIKVVQTIQEHLLIQHAEGRHTVMFVEEAQSMPIDTLEELRLLSNLETREAKLLQIVLFGQPELEENLSVQHIRQLKERITYNFNLAPLQEYEVRDYLNSRLRSSGYQGMDLFTRKAVKEVWKYSGGLLRRINIIADKACLAAFADNNKSINQKHIKLAVKDSEFANIPGVGKKAPDRLVALALLAVVVIGLGAFFYDKYSQNSAGKISASGGQNNRGSANSEQVTGNNKGLPKWQNTDQNVKRF